MSEDVASVLVVAGVFLVIGLVFYVSLRNDRKDDNDHWGPS